MDQQRAPQDRPAFPEEAVRWLLGSTPRTAVVLGDPLIAAAFADYGHDVTDVEGVVDDLPLPNRSVDVVVCSGRLPADLEFIARVLRPGGQLALVCNERDQRIPWARKLDQAIGVRPAGEAPAAGVVNSTLFGFVSDSSFRYWQVVNHTTLEALVRAELAHLDDAETDRRTTAALELYADYGRGADGMQMPWLSRCFKATVVENAWAPPHGLDEGSNADEPEDDETEPPADGATGLAAKTPKSALDGSDSDLLLIDFR